MKQTAVEFLEEEIFRSYKFLLQKVDCAHLEESIKQAKEIEKQQIVDAFEIGYENGACVNEGESIYYGSKYYKKTFNK